MKIFQIVEFLKYFWRQQIGNVSKISQALFTGDITFRKHFSETPDFHLYPLKKSTQLRLESDVSQRKCVRESFSISIERNLFEWQLL